MPDGIDVERDAESWRDDRLDLIVDLPLVQAWRYPPEPLDDAPYVRVHGEDVAVKAVHHYAPRCFDAYARKAAKKGLRVRVRHVAERLERELAERGGDDVEGPAQPPHLR